MITILFDREFTNPDDKIIRTFTDNRLGLFAPSVPCLINDLDSYIQMIPAHERYNVHYTLGYNSAAGKRDWVSQDVLAFDFDKIDIDKIHDYIDLFFRNEAFKDIDKDTCAVFCSGNGLHIILPIDKFESATFFKEHNHSYQTMCSSLDRDMADRQLVGMMDRGVFCKNHTLRLPNTVNRKNGIDKNSYVIQKNIVHSEHNFSFSRYLSKQVAAGNVSHTIGHYNKDKLKPKHKNVDVDLIFDPSKGCKFLAEYKLNASKMFEPEWYAMLGVVYFIDEELCHTLSQPHKTYSRVKTDIKIDQVRMLPGPWSCEAISGHTHGYCATCPHKGKVRSPIDIKGDDFFPTKDDGFYILEMKKDGSVRRIPDIQGISRYYQKTFCHKCDSTSEDIYIWNGSYYKVREYLFVDQWIRNTMHPVPHTSVVTEVVKNIMSMGAVTQDFFNPPGYFNFKSRVWDISANKYIDRTPALGFTSCLPFDADDSGSTECPTFKNYLHTAMAGDKDLIQILCEYMAYCISDIDPRVMEQMLFLEGQGSNGKSVYLDVMKWIVGEEHFGALSLDAMQKPENLYDIVNKTVNLCDEIDKNTDLKPSMLKNIVSGGEVMVRKLYVQPFKHRMRTKFIFSANALPYIADDSHGMRRRIIIVPFNVKFGDEADADAVADKNLRNNLKKEIPQIFNYLCTFIPKLKRDKKFTQPKECTEKLDEFMDSNDTLNFYLKHFVDIDDNVVVDITNNQFMTLYALYQNYQETSKSIGNRTISIMTFFKRMKQTFKKRIATRRVGGRETDVIYGFRPLEREEY